MAAIATLKLRTISQTLELNSKGRREWRVKEILREIPASQTALLLCDVWDDHGCLSALSRLGDLLPKMEMAVSAAREKGLLIVHAPSDTMNFYKDHPARKRVLSASKAPDPVNRPHDDPPLPVSDKDGGCDGGGDSHRVVWSRQNKAITIDPERDVISDQGRELLNVYAERGIKTILIAGVHTNMCVLHRSFAIKQMVRWGYEVFLLRDLTDALYNPESPPYVSYEEGFRLIVEFIEKFWCPSADSRDLL